MSMTKSEEIISLISSKFFLKQFTYSEIYVLKDSQEQEFCDCMLEFSNVYICIQIKEKSDKVKVTPEKWFKDRVLNKAKKQLRDTFNYFKNEEYKIFSKNTELHIDRNKAIIPLIVFLNNDVSNYDRIVVSKTLNRIINIFNYEDFSTMLNTLILPYDIISYLNYRIAFKQVDEGKIIFDNIDDSSTIVACPHNEKDYAELFLAHYYYKTIIENKLSEENIKFYNTIIYQLNEMRGCLRDNFLSGFLQVDYVRADTISQKWQDFVKYAKQDKFVAPFKFTIDDRVYMFFVKPKSLTETEFQIRMDLCLVYYKYKHNENLAHILLFKNEENEQYSVSIGDVNLNTDIPYESLIETAIEFFEK